MFSVAAVTALCNRSAQCVCLNFGAADLTLSNGGSTPHATCTKRRLDVGTLLCDSCSRDPCFKPVAFLLQNPPTTAPDVSAPCCKLVPQLLCKFQQHLGSCWTHLLLLLLTAQITSVVPVSIVSTTEMTAQITSVVPVSIVSTTELIYSRLNLGFHQILIHHVLPP
jgi:hypothetical protein